MPPKKLRRRRSSTERRRRVATREGVKAAARNHLAELQSAGDERTRDTLVVKFPSEDHATVFAAATAVAAAGLASATDVEDGLSPRGAWLTSTPPRCSSTSSTPAAPYRAPETTANGPSAHLQPIYPHRHRAGGVRSGNNSLLAENRRRA